MGRKLKAIQLLINSKLPDDLRDYSRDYDVKSIGQLMSAIADKYPNRYPELSKFIGDVGREASYRQGETITYHDLKPVVDVEQEFVKPMQKELAKLDPRAEDFEQKRNKIWSKYADLIEKESIARALKNKNNIAYSVISGARGKPAQLKAMLATPALYTDHRDRIIPLFIRRSYGEGLRPAEFLAGTFGARKSVISTKRSVAKGGDLSKQAVQSAVNTVVTENDCGTNNGRALSIDEPSIKGRFLAKEVNGIPAGTPVDRSVLSQLKKKGIKEVVVRSPMTCASEPGICSHCVGKFFDNRLPKIGDSVGVTSSNALFEPVAQGALSTKHTSGIAESQKDFSGFDALNQFVQVPQEFPNRAAVSEESGRVNRIEDAPQGGKYVVVNDTRHYVTQGFNPAVKEGDKVEQGDVLSEGLANPADIVRLRGIGEGRKYYAERMKKILDDSGKQADLRNVEMLARSAVNHVTIDDEDGINDMLPGDVSNFNYLQKKYIPPESTRLDDPGNAEGQFLQAPYMHYTVGTKITPNIAKDLKVHGYDNVAVDARKPGFSPYMVRLRQASHTNPDWLASMHTSYLKRQLEDAGVKGQETNIEENTHFVPRLAYGKGFGDKIKQTGKF